MFQYSATICLRNVCVSGVPLSGSFLSFFHYYYWKMVFEIFPVIALDQYTERKLLHPSPCTSIHHWAWLVNGSWPHPLLSGTQYTTGRFIQRKTKLFTQPSVKITQQIIRPDQNRCLWWGHCQLFAGWVYKNVCKTTKCSDVICIL